LEFTGQQIQNAVRSHPDYGTRKLRILDVGEGKGVLPNYIAQLLGDAVQVQVIDIACGALTLARGKAYCPTILRNFWEMLFKCKSLILRVVLWCDEIQALGCAC
jgi:2-polyprenyl-3-methyl-5-hydroxy-6-metoxy-1,4-benzoquinol methylase